MKKSNKTNRKSTRTSTRNSSQKLFRNGAQGFEALEPRQMLDAGLSNALFDSPIPYTESQEISTTFLSVKPSSDTLADGNSVYAGIRVYGMDSSGIRQATENYTITSIEKVNEDGSKTPISILEQGQGLQGTYSFACAEMLLGQEYSITVTWNGTSGTAPNFGAIAYLLGDTNAFEVSTELPAKDANGYIANQQANIAECEVTLVKAAMMLDDPETNWQHQQGTNLLGQSGFSEQYTEMFSLDTNAYWESSDLARVQTNQKAGTVNFHLTFDQEAPALSVNVTNQDGNFAGTAIVSEGSKTGKVQSFTVNVNTSTDSPILNMTFTDAKSNIKSIEYSVDGTNYTKLDITGEKKTESFSFDWLSKVGSKLTEGTTSNIYVKTADVIGNTGAYTFNVSYTASVEYTVGKNAKTTLEGGKTVEGKDNTLFTNTADGSTLVNVNPDFTIAEEATTSQRVGVKFGDTIYYANYQDFSSAASTASLKLTDFDGLLAAMGAKEGTIPDGTYTLTAFVQDNFGHEAQQVGLAQTLVIDTVAPVIETVSVAGDTSGVTSIADATTADVIVTLSNADATDIKVVVALDSSTSASQEGTITAGDLKSSTIMLTKGSEYKYGKNDFTVTLTDAAGNVATKTFTLWYNTTPTADQLEVSAKEWGAFNEKYSTEEYTALDFASKVDDSGETETKNLTIKVDATTVTNGDLYKSEDGVYTKLEAEGGFYTFKATENISFLADEYYFGTVTLKYTVTDDANTPATSAENNVVISIEAVDTQVVVNWKAPSAVDENSIAVDQTIGTFTYPDNEPRKWSATWTKGTTDAHIYNDKSDKDKTTLFTTEPSFTVVAGDTDAVGMTTYSIVMKDWALAQYLWGTQDFTLTVKGKMGEKSTADTETTSDKLTFTVNAVDQLPQAGSTKQFNVSLSTLSKGDITLTLDDTMFSDIDDTYDKLSIPSVTLKSGNGMVELTTAEPTKTLDVNGVSVEFTLDGKTIVISQNTSKALDKEAVEISFTVEDSFKETVTATGSTIKFSAYASDDSKETVQDTASYSFNVLKNDYDNSDKWDGKTFTITSFDSIDSSIGMLTLVDAGSIEGNNFTFVPATNYRGTFSFNYTITNSDDTTETAQATVTVIVAALNTAPTADAISASGDEWGEQDKDHTAQTYINVDFAKAIGDNAEETAQSDLVIAMSGTGITDNGTWYYLKDGKYTQITDLSNVQLKNGDVYFSPNNYWNGTLNVAYTVTDSITGWVNSSLKVASDQTALTASNSIVIVVANKATDPVISEQADKTIDESGSATTGTANVAKATMPSGSENEAVATVTAVSKSMTAHQLNDGSDSLSKLFDSYTFDLDTTTGLITCNYTQIPNVYGTQTFTVTVKSDLGGETSFDWTITVNAVNTAPSITANTDKFELAEGKYVLKTNLTEEAEPTEGKILLGTVSDFDNVLDSLDISVQTISKDGGHVWTNNLDTATALFTSADFEINADKNLYFTYTLAKQVHGEAIITVQLNDNESSVTPNNLKSNEVVYRIVADSVNDAPVANTADWNVSVATLGKGSVTFDFNTVVSDVDDYDEAGNSKVTLTALKLGETTIALDGTDTDVTVNGITLKANYDATAKTLSLTAPTGELTALDKQSLAIAYTISDNATTDAKTADGTGTVKFTMYAQDDTYGDKDENAINEAAGEDVILDVLTNDQPNWGDKTFEITNLSALSDTSAGTISVIHSTGTALDTVLFTPASDYRGTFTFQYTITEVGGTETATATVTVTVRALNHVPTAEQVDASMDESQTGTDKVRLVFDTQVADDESSDSNLTIRIATSAVQNGSLVDKDGNPISLTSGSYAFKATDEVYFKPNQYYNGTVTIPYTVEDTLSDVTDKGYTLVSGETIKTATSNAVIIINAVGTTPTVNVEAKNHDEIASAPTQTTIEIGTATMPEGAEALDKIEWEAGTKTAHILNAGADKVDALLKDASFALDTKTGKITFTYTQIEHVWGSQTFDLTVTTAEGGTKTVSWTFTVNSVNDVPTTEGISEQGTVTDKTGTWSKTTDQLKASILAKSADIDDSLTAANITIATTGLPEGMTYDSDTDTYSLTTTALSTKFEISYTINDNHGGTVDGKITVSFNQVPYINNYTGFKSLDTSESKQEGSWKLFDLSDVIDPEGKTVTKDNIAVSNAEWIGDTLYMNYSFNQGAFGSNVATVTISDPEDSSIKAEYTFNLAAYSSLALELDSADQLDMRHASDDNPLYVDFTTGKMSATATTLDLTAMLGTLAEGEEYTVTYNFVQGVTEDACNPVTAIISEDGKLTLQVSAYTPYLDLAGSIEVAHGSNVITIPVAFYNNYEQTTTIDIQYFVTDTAGKTTLNNAAVDRSQWFDKDMEERSDSLKKVTDEQLNDETGTPLYWQLDYCDEEYWTTTPTVKDYPVYNNGSPVTDDNDNQWYWDFNKVSIKECTTNVKPSKSRDRYEVMKRTVESVAMKTEDLAYDEDHYLYLYASDSWNQEGLVNPLYFAVFTVDFGAEIILGEQTSSLGDILVDQKESTVYEFAISNLNRKSGGIFEDVYAWLATFPYTYKQDYGENTPEITISFANKYMRDMGGTGEFKELNQEQVVTAWAANCNPNDGLYGTQGADETVVEGTGIYMVATTAQDTVQTAETLPQSEEWIHEWQSHYVDLYLNTQDADVTVDGQVSFTLNYNPALFTATDFTSISNIFNGVADISTEDGKIRICGFLKDGVTTEDGFVLLGRVKFDSVDSNGLDANTIGTVELGLSMDHIRLYNTAEEQLEVNENVSVKTRVAAVVYDSNDDGFINSTDFLNFATYYGTDTVASNDVLAWALDFDKSGKIDSTDFIQFATYYGVSRENGKPLDFSEGFLKQYIGSTIEGEGDADLTALLEQAVGEWEAKLGTDLDVNIQLKVKNYDDTQLGESYIVTLADDGTPLTGVIVLDTDAAGRYWSINSDEVLEGKYDLYSVILHEVGHVLGYTQQYSAFEETTKEDETIKGSHTTVESDLMYETINPGERKSVSYADAQKLSDAYDYASEHNVWLTYSGTSGEAIYATEEIASGIVDQEQWTKTLETKVYEELDRIVTENRNSVFAVEDDEEEDEPILDDFAAVDFTFDLASKAESEGDSLFDDLSWIDGDSADNTELEVELKEEF